MTNIKKKKKKKNPYFFVTTEPNQMGFLPKCIILKHIQID